MAWDNSQPQNTTKIRNLGVVIRPNWLAIEQADATLRLQGSNFADRTAAGLSNNPAAIADTFIIYCKESTAGDSEFYAIDENSNVFQLTAEGRIGGPATNFKINNIQFSDTTNYTRNNIVACYGRFDAAGATIVANNCAISRLSTGVYQVVMTPDPGSTNYVPVATANDEGGPRICKINVVSSTTFTIRIQNEQSLSRDCGGYFQVVGGF